MNRITEVVWKAGFPSRGVNVSDAYKALERIRKAADGKLDPADIVASVSKAKRHVLKSFFEWDDTKAAEEHRIEQARGLVRAVHVVYEDAPKIQTRAYEVIRQPGQDVKPRKLYQTLEDVLADPGSRAELLKRAMNELVSLQGRFRGLQELAVVFRAIDEVLTTIKP